MPVVSVPNTPATDLSRRMGHFTVSMPMILQATPGMVALFSGSIVIDTNYEAETGMIGYLALHPVFDALDPGEGVPRYDVTCFESRSGDGTITTRFEWRRLP